MEALQRLEALSNQHNLALEHNDRLFYSKYLYSIELWPHINIGILELMRVPTIDVWGYKVDSHLHASFIGSMRKYAKKHGDKVRVEHRTLNYYTNEIDTMVKIADYVDRIHSRQEEIVDNMVELRSIRYFPGTVAERNIRFLNDA